MPRKRDRFADEQSSARRRKARARRTRSETQDELERLYEEEYEECKRADLKRARAIVEGLSDDLAALLTPSAVVPDSHLGASRRRKPGRGKPSWA